MFRLFPKKKKSRFHSFSALFVQRKFAEFSANEIRGEKKKREEGEGEGGNSIKEILSVAARAIERRANANINPN